MKTTANRAIVAGMLAMLAFILTAYLAPPSHARDWQDSRPCVTRGEWRRIHMGMTPATVAGILDGSGSYKAVSEGYAYAVCNTDPGDALALLRYRDGRLWQALWFDFSEIS